MRGEKEFPRLGFSNRMFKISRLEYNQNNLDNQKYHVVSLLKNGAHSITKNLSESNEKLGQIKNNLIEYITSIDSYNFLIALMDIYKAFSTKVSSGNYTRPIFSDRSTFRT